MVIALFLAFCTAALIGYAVVPLVYSRSMILSQKRASVYASKLDRVLPRRELQKTIQLYMLAPLFLGAIFYFVFPSEIRFFGVVLGAILGFIFPGIYTTVLLKTNRKKFDDQMIDALMIMSSSFRGGLSLIQAMEAVVEEMPDPINQEFATILGENKMGVSLEDALTHFYTRMPSAAVQQTITAVLLARETGGNLPEIFKRIVNVMRERKRIQMQIDTLTLQGKIQGVVMSILPVAFFFVIRSSSPGFYDHMFKSEVGRVLMVYACVAELVGVYLIWKISLLKDY